MTTGLIAGAAAALGALAILWFSSAANAVAHNTGMEAWLVMAEVAAVSIISGALYGRLFMRAANDARGGWLFGISFGFLLWMLGPATILQWILHRPVAVGRAAQAAFLAHLVYGLLLGTLFPLIHHVVKRRSHVDPHPQHRV